VSAINIRTKSGFNAENAEVISGVPFQLEELRFLKFINHYPVPSPRSNQTLAAHIATALVTNITRNFLTGEYAKLAQENMTHNHLCSKANQT